MLYEDRLLLIALKINRDKWILEEAVRRSSFKMRCQRSDGGGDESSSSMSDYGSDLEDVELELRREVPQKNIYIK